ncbi:DUF2442 domain-containing protein [Duganella violaceipulchra]|uniref:DUF2442 domain-containing protein n=1 Tax=Duganella violaceipulchra TaxID=2849652 RepID=A0ABT1GHV4_9BURK|nr:DUF2442 domain-containing protein [Duganella violaceicalia]MCP2008096.1 hypothetical protein [Duganella violaceicalia]
MTTLTIPDERIKGVSFDADLLTVELMDGRRISTPLAWYPRFAGATIPELQGWEIIGDGDGLHWEQFDEDLSVEGMLRGFPAAGFRTGVKR